jgi:hypothetical protein
MRTAEFFPASYVLLPGIDDHDLDVSEADHQRDAVTVMQSRRGLERHPGRAAERDSLRRGDVGHRCLTGLGGALQPCPRWVAARKAEQGEVPDVTTLHEFDSTWQVLLVPGRNDEQVDLPIPRECRAVDEIDEIRAGCATADHHASLPGVEQQAQLLPGSPDDQPVTERPLAEQASGDDAEDQAERRQRDLARHPPEAHGRELSQLPTRSVAKPRPVALQVRAHSARRTVLNWPRPAARSRPPERCRLV